MAKLSGVDRAIAALEVKKAAIDAAIAELREQQGKPVKRNRPARPVAVVAAKEA